MRFRFSIKQVLSHGALNRHRLDSAIFWNRLVETQLKKNIRSVSHRDTVLRVEKRRFDLKISYLVGKWWSKSLFFFLKFFFEFVFRSILNNRRRRRRDKAHGRSWWHVLRRADHRRVRRVLTHAPKSSRFFAETSWPAPADLSRRAKRSEPMIYISAAAAAAASSEQTKSIARVCGGTPGRSVK